MVDIHHLQQTAVCYATNPQAQSGYVGSCWPPIGSASVLPLFMFCLQIKDHVCSSGVDDLPRVWGLSLRWQGDLQDALPQSPAVMQSLASSALPSDHSATSRLTFFHGRTKCHTPTLRHSYLCTQLFPCNRSEVTKSRQLPVKHALDWWFFSGLLCWIPNCTNGPNEPRLLVETGKATLRVI